MPIRAKALPEKMSVNKVMVAYADALSLFADNELPARRSACLIRKHASLVHTASCLAVHCALFETDALEKSIINIDRIAGSYSINS